VRKLEAHVLIRLHGGRVVEKHVEHALGSLEHPMSDRDLEDKFRGLADGILTSDRAQRVIDLCWRLEELEDAGELVHATVP
jgi:2-methylcitrate dehydratase PrpD